MSFQFIEYASFDCNHAQQCFVSARSLNQRRLFSLLLYHDSEVGLLAIQAFLRQVWTHQKGKLEPMPFAASSAGTCTMSAL